MIHVAYNIGPAATCYVLEFHYAERTTPTEVRYWNSPLYSLPYEVELEKHVAEKLSFTELADRFNSRC